MGLRPSSKALRNTKRVWGIGPSAASTRRRQPSTMPSTRSTSPPKSVWPGGVDYVDLDSLVLYGGVLGEDGDAALPLQHVRVHRPFGERLSMPQLGSLLQQAVHERRLAWSTCAIMAMFR